MYSLPLHNIGKSYRDLLFILSLKLPFLHFLLPSFVVPMNRIRSKHNPFAFLDVNIANGKKRGRIAIEVWRLPL